MTRFAAWLVKEREARQWSTVDVAGFIRCDPSLVWRWEAGESLPRLERFAALILLYNADANAALRLVPNAPERATAA